MYRTTVLCLLFGVGSLSEAATQSSLQLAITPDTVAMRGLAEGRFVLAAPAPPGGTTVRLRSLTPSLAVVPEQVIVPEGQSTGTFPIEAGDLTRPASERVTITATSDTSFSDAQLRIARNQVSLDISPRLLYAGASATGTLTLSYPARKGGMTIPLSTPNPGSFDMPASVVVPQGERSATFALKHDERYVRPQIEIWAFNEDTGETARQPVTIQLNEVRDLSFQPSGRAVSGTVVTCIARLWAPAVRDMELHIGIRESGAPLILPVRVTIQAGQEQVVFPIQYTEVFKTTSVSLAFATYPGGAGLSAGLIVDPTSVTALQLEKTDLAPGERTKGTVTLEAPAPPGGIHVLIAPDPESAVTIVPYGLDVPGGERSGVFEVVAKPVSAETPLTISAIYRGITFQKAKLRVTTPAQPETPRRLSVPKISRTPIGVPIVRLKRLEVVVVRSSTGSGDAVSIGVFLSGPAPPPGADVRLSSTPPRLLVLPSALTVDPGRTSAQITVKPSSRTRARTSVTIGASYGGVSQTQTVTIQ